MICPLKLVNHEQHLTCECLEDNCAWYIKEYEKCSVAAIAQNSEILSEVAAGQRTLFVREV